MYLTITRTKNLFPMSVFSSFLNCASEQCMMAAKRVVRYLKGTLTYGIRFSKCQTFKLRGYFDSDQGGSTGDMKELLVDISLLDQNVSHSAQRNRKQQHNQQLKQNSTHQQPLWLRKILIDLQLEKAERTEILVDNQAAIAISKIPCFMEGRSTSTSSFIS